MTKSVPTVAVLAPQWESRSEPGWITRQIAGALACGADVHIITPEGDTPQKRTDSIFTVHELANPIQPTAQVRRHALVNALGNASKAHSPQSRNVGHDHQLSSEFGSILDADLITPWESAAEVLTTLRPDAVVIAGHQELGALDVVDQTIGATPITLIALGTEDEDVTFPHFDRMFDRSQAVLAVTETERSQIIERHQRSNDVHRIGAPMAANPSALSEPNPWVGSGDYVLVLVDRHSQSKAFEVQLANLAKIRFSDYPVGISYTDVFVAWHEGRSTPGWPVERAGDLARLMAWARVVVDLRPKPLFARRCVDALLYGTPIIVPADSRAKEHAELGGGLWFSNPAELMWGIEAMLTPVTRQIFSDQGREYAEEYYGSTDRFVERIGIATGIDLGVTQPVT